MSGAGLFSLTWLPTAEKIKPGAGGAPGVARRRPPPGHADVMTQPFLAAGNRQQPGIERRAPVPPQPELDERSVERLAVGFLGVSERAVEIKNECFQHQRASSAPARNTRLARMSSASMVIRSLGESGVPR